jgi:DNA-dependent RNA polymerase auxiliary subunit epsilon
MQKMYLLVLGIMMLGIVGCFNYIDTIKIPEGSFVWEASESEPITFYNNRYIERMEMKFKEITEEEYVTAKKINVVRCRLTDQTFSIEFLIDLKGYERKRVEVFYGGKGQPQMKHMYHFQFRIDFCDDPFAIFFGTHILLEKSDTQIADDNNQFIADSFSWGLLYSRSGEYGKNDIKFPELVRK